MKIKVCGLRNAVNIKEIARLSPDLMGFICYEPSPRFIGNMPEAALNELPAGLIKTGVFVNESFENITAMINKYGFNAVQLHGDESAELCRLLQQQVTVLKAFGIDEVFDFEQLKAYRDSVDFFIFDTKTNSYGGSGKTFNWSVLNHYRLDVPFFLSGGLSADNLEEIKNIKHPQLYGVDLNSRFEIELGLKDVDQLKKAFEILKQTDTHEIRS